MIFSPKWTAVLQIFPETSSNLCATESWQFSFRLLDSAGRRVTQESGVVLHVPWCPMMSHDLRKLEETKARTTSIPARLAEICTESRVKHGYSPPSRNMNKKIGSCKQSLQLHGYFKSTAMEKPFFLDRVLKSKTVLLQPGWIAFSGDFRQNLILYPSP